MSLLGKFLEDATKAVKEAATEENLEKAKGMLNDLGSKIGTAAKEAASQENIDKAKGVLSSIGSVISSAARDVKEKIEEEDAEQAKIKEYFTPDDDPRDAREKILQVLKDEFPQYSVREDVSPTELGGTGRFMNYSIGVYDGSAPKLFMMLIGKTTTSHREYRWSREVAEKNGIPMINFVKHYPNKVAYITERLHQYL